jgi:ferredoxin
MEIKVNIPDWAIGMPVYVIAGKELLAYTHPIIRKENGKRILEYSELKIKTDRCNGCGVCCKDCVFVRNTGCPFGEQIPLSCIVSDCSQIKECSEKFINGLDK